MEAQHNDIVTYMLLGRTSEKKKSAAEPGSSLNLLGEVSKIHSRYWRVHLHFLIFKYP